MSKTRNLSEKVLEYWFTMEFLGQEKYPFREHIDASAGADKLKHRLIKGQSGYSSVSDFFLFPDETDLYGGLCREAQSCRMKRWGNITLYIGKVKREACIRYLAETLGGGDKKEERPEKNRDEIACASLLLTPEGKYVEDSLSLSPILWAAAQLGGRRKTFGDALDEERYRAEKKRLEALFFTEENTQALTEADFGEEQEKAELSNEEIQSFDFHAVTVGLLKKLCAEIEKTYIKGKLSADEGEEPFSFQLGVFLQFFQDEAAKNREEDENYQGLSRDYFSDDLKMLLKEARAGRLPRHVEDYILGACMEKELFKKDRMEMVHPEDRELFARQIQELFHVKNAPLGKWSSKFMPAFMQQAAVNLAVAKGKGKLFQKNGPVFSVNGPPGTGKTTLLKEIIVSNIVDRAVLLAEYENPEDAFEGHFFQEGKCYNHSYSKYVPRWYSLKNDRINDHSILVASCNNAAVENISKELPVGKGMGELFDPEKTLAMESYEKNSIQYPEIYFTYYASNLLEEKNAWGLAAAALGKRKNIRNFYQSVLRPLRWDFYPGKDSVSNRLRRYQEARKAFLKQLDLVKKLQEEEAVLCDLALRKMKLKSEIQKYPKEDMEARIAAAEKEAERLCQNITEDREQKAVYENQEKEGKQEVTALRQRALDSLQSVGKKPLLFGKKEYQSRFSRAEALAKELEQQAEEAEKKRSGILEKIKELSDQISQREQELFQTKDALEDLYGQKNKQEARVKELEKTSREYKMRCGQQGTGIPLDEELIEGLLSDDKERSTKAQTQNPWFTERYNREREKLFFCALQVNREFILSSRACRDNFTSLAHYWGLQTGDEKERIIFGEEDRRSCVAALYQTLFLLTPVISTTFASVGSFFKDVKQDNAVGLLIVDEAGQAQPQMAAGALYRSRRAVIVGDPKQVEPVVTDDLKLLKRAFDDVRLLPYTSSKTASVQSFADAINAFGASLESPEHPEEPDWVGCPLLVHRRCISPMYEISNTISYGGIMKQKTAPPSPELEETFLFERSQWIQIRGREKGGKNHFVEAQGEKVCRMLEEAFSKNEFPSLYIISPFVTVVSGVRACIRAYIKKNASSALAKAKGLEEWMGKNIGTVHTFQGKEANEVIFLLGCDGSREAKGAVAWVNSNIVNVAATRAKYRLYVLGDAKVWAENANLLTVKKILDTYALREIVSALENTSLDTESREKAVEQALKCLPPAASFAADSGDEASLDGGEELETESFVQAMADWELFKRPFTEAELQKFKFSGREELENLGEQVKRNLNLAMRLYFFFRPLYAKHKNFDASCCAVLFCKALELQVRERLWTGMKKDLPDCEIRGQGKGRGRISLREAKAEELTLGTFRHLIEKNAETLGKRMSESGAPDYAGPWWEVFGKRLASCTQKRNQCCHAGLFTWRELSCLLKDMFLDSDEVPNMKGVFFACGVWEEVGKEE